MYLSKFERALVYVCIPHRFDHKEDADMRMQVCEDSLSPVSPFYLAFFFNKIKSN